MGLTVGPLPEHSNDFLIAKRKSWLETLENEQKMQGKRKENEPTKRGNERDENGNERNKENWREIKQLRKVHGN